jgi:putative ABC transport system permease protein
MQLPFNMVFQELYSNRLRTFLSLLGVSIGVFCIIGVRTVFNSLENSIQSSMSSLGSDVLYVGKFAWIPEDKGDYAWWKYKARPVCTLEELNTIKKDVTSVGNAALYYQDDGVTIKYKGVEHIDNSIYATTFEFDKLQPINIEQGRYFTQSEMKSNSNSIIIGHETSVDLFGYHANPLGKEVILYGKVFNVIGVLQKAGKSFTGFDFDHCGLISFVYFSSFTKIDGRANNGFSEVTMLLQPKGKMPLEEMKYEVKGALRMLRRLPPREKDNFSFNQLSTIQNTITDVFASVNLMGLAIGFFSLMVGIFGVANIMFVSVRERTKQIGLKKAIGAKPSSIVAEFLLEAIMLCIIGGLVGILLVYISSIIISKVADFKIQMQWSNVLGGLVLSIFVGVIAGYIPAKRASKLNPVVAIRS